MDHDRREAQRVLVFSASSRADSFNTRLANLVGTAIEGLSVAWVELLGEHPLPPSTSSTPEP
jgi:NAD(P)H-dependent FMN reductase